MTRKYFLVEITLPPGIVIGDLSRRFPETRFHIVSGQWAAEDERVLFVLNEHWTEEQLAMLGTHADVKELDLQANIVRLHLKTDFLRAIEQNRMTVLYPTTLQNGKHSIGLLLEPDQFAHLHQRLPHLHVISIQDKVSQKVALSKRQLEILYQADALGYYQYPRKITLTDLSKLLRISKATLSQTLRAIEKKAITTLLQQLRQDQGR